MVRLKHLLATGSLVALFVTGGMLATTQVASAEIACNSAGECWHVKRHYEYPPTLGIHIYGDEWRRSHEHDRHYHWMRNRDDDRGYYSNGEWHSLGR